MKVGFIGGGNNSTRTKSWTISSAIYQKKNFHEIHHIKLY